MCSVGLYMLSNAYSLQISSGGPRVRGAFCRARLRMSLAGDVGVEGGRVRRVGAAVVRSKECYVMLCCCLQNQMILLFFAWALALGTWRGRTCEMVAWACTIFFLYYGEVNRRACPQVRLIP